eukprot:Skav235290  [mRNA]  locus=scaffold4363:9603:32666:- [translate_table: standard]
MEEKTFAHPAQYMYKDSPTVLVSLWCSGVFCAALTICITVYNVRRHYESAREQGLGHHEMLPSFGARADRIMQLLLVPVVGAVTAAAQMQFSLLLPLLGAVDVYVDQRINLPTLAALQRICEVLIAVSTLVGMWSFKCLLPFMTKSIRVEEVDQDRLASMERREIPFALASAAADAPPGETAPTIAPTTISDTSDPLSVPCVGRVKGSARRFPLRHMRSQISDESPAGAASRGFATNHPVCPSCGGPARPAILMFGDYSWQDNDAQEARRAGLADIADQGAAEDAPRLPLQEIRQALPQ